MVEHLPMVRALVRKRWSGRVRHHDLEDLCQAGAIGLMQAARRFDPAGGVAFGTYARWRVLGNALDHIRRTRGRHGERVIETRDDLDDQVGGMGPAGVAGDIHPVRAAVCAALKHHPPRVVHMAMANIFDRRPLRDLAAEAGISASRASQIVAPMRIEVRALIEAACR